MQSLSSRLDSPVSDLTGNPAMSSGINFHLKQIEVCYIKIKLAFKMDIFTITVPKLYHDE